MKPERHPRAIKEGTAESADGTRLRFTVYGEGLPLALCNGIGCSTMYFNYLRDYFEESLQVITWDYKGHGKSGDPANYNHLSMGDCADDLRRVLDAAGVESAVIGGHSMGCQVIFEAYRQFPDRVKGLIPILGSFESPIDNLMDSELPKYAFPFIYLLGTTFPKQARALGKIIFNSPLMAPLARLFALNPLLTPEHDMRAYFEHLSQLDPRLFYTMALEMQRHSARDVLPKIACPTLILAGSDDNMTPAWRSEEMHKLIAGSELMLIHTGSHVGLIEQPLLVNLRIEKFLVEHFDIPRPKATRL